MSPVRESKARNPRSLVLAIGGVALGLLLLVVLFIVAIPALTESGTVKVKLGADTFDAGSAEDRAESIAASGPVIYPDVSGGTRDIYLQHLGDDPNEGWYAFETRRPGQGRNCPLEWRTVEAHFVDACDGTVIPADGTGLLSYPVVVTEDGNLVVDLNPDDGQDITSTTGG